MDQFEKFLKTIPVMPDVATKILTFAEDLDEVSFSELESLISMDPGLTAKILRVCQFSPLCQTAADLPPADSHITNGIQGD